MNTRTDNNPWTWYNLFENDIEEEKVKPLEVKHTGKEKGTKEIAELIPPHS